jgi:hypothetical protein
VASVVIDDHLLRDILTGEREPDLGGIAPEGLATTGLWLFRLCSSLADPGAAGKLSLAAAHRLQAGVAVSEHDIGPNLKASANADGVAFHAL